MSGEQVRGSYIPIQNIQADLVHPLMTEEHRRILRSLEVQVHEEVARAFTIYTEEERRGLEKSINFALLYGSSNPRLAKLEPKLKKHRLGVKSVR